MSVERIAVDEHHRLPGAEVLVVQVDVGRVLFVDCDVSHYVLTLLAGCPVIGTQDPGGEDEPSSSDSTESQPGTRRRRDLSRLTAGGLRASAGRWRPGDGAGVSRRDGDGLLAAAFRFGLEGVVADGEPGDDTTD